MNTKGWVLGLHNLKNKTIYEEINEYSEFMLFGILLDIFSSLLRSNPNNHSTEVKTITISNNIPTSNWMPLEIHGSTLWHPPTYIFIKSKYLYQLINYSDDSSKTNQTFFFIVKYKISSLVSSDEKQLDNITVFVKDNTTLNINGDNENNDFIKITVLSASLDRKIGVIGKIHTSSMTSSNFHLYQIESFYFCGG
jgi:hypothetical protein